MLLLLLKTSPPRLSASLVLLISRIYLKLTSHCVTSRKKNLPNKGTRRLCPSIDSC